MKKTLFLLLCLWLLLAAGTAMAVSGGTCGDSLEWTLDDDGVLTVSGTGPMTSTPWSGKKEQITSVVIQNGVTSVYFNAFTDCSNLKSVIVPESVATLMDGAFQSCESLSEIHVDSLDWYLNHAGQSLQLGTTGHLYINGAPLTDLTIPDGTTVVQAFQYCTDLKSVTIPNSVVDIYGSSFMGCDSLQQITLPFVGTSRTSTGISARFNIIFGQNVPETLETVVLTDVETIGQRAFMNCSDVKQITFPDSVTGIGDYAFSGCSKLTEITWPTQLTTIGNYAFASSGFTDVVLPNSVETVGQKAFIYCYSLSSVVLSDHLTSLNGTFSYCSSLASVTIPVSVTQLTSPFTSCSQLTDIYYAGSDTEWEAISKQSFSTQATIHFARIDIPENPVASGSCGDGLTWMLNDGGSLIIAGDGSMEDFTDQTAVPWYAYRETIKRVAFTGQITSIGDCAFMGCTSLGNTDIPQTVTHIGYRAFYGCSSITKMKIPENVVTIGSAVFANCSSLTEVKLLGISIVPYDTFNGCRKLETVVLGENVEQICSTSFSSTAIRRLDLPVSVKVVNYLAFLNCSYLNDIYYAGTEARWAQLIDNWGKVWSDSVTVHFGSIEVQDTVVASGDCGDTVTWYVNDLGSLFVRGSGVMESYEAETAPWYSYRESIKRGYVEGNITEIGDYAFYNLGMLKKVILPDSLQKIGNHAFQNTSTLKDITLPAAVASIGDYAFQNAPSIRDITLPDAIVSVGDHAFYGTSVNHLEWPEGLQSVGEYAFYGCEFTSVTVPDTVTELKDGIFSGCKKLTEISLPVGLNAIPNALLRNCTSLQSITIPEGVTTIGEYAFADCSALQSITIPEGITTTGESAFLYCSSLSRVVLPSTMESIGDHSFYGCSALTDISLPNGLVRIGSCAFYGCSALTDITLPDSLVSLGDLAFHGCSSLLKVSGSITLSSVGMRCFEGCSSLKNVEFVYGMDSIPQGLFKNCGSLESFTIHAGTKSISEYAFEACESLKAIVIPESVTYIGERAFYGCVNTEITVAGHVTVYPYAFAFCKGLKEITLADVGQRIKANSLADCVGLERVVLPIWAQVIEEGVFDGCSSLADVHYEGTQSVWNKRVTMQCSLPEGASLSFGDYRGICGGTVWTLKDRTVRIFTDGGRHGYVYQNEDLSADLENCDSVIVEEGITELGYGVFQNSAGVAQITLPAGLETINDRVFFGCSGLTKMILPDSVQTVGEWAFRDCSGLTELILPDSIRQIGYAAFSGCSSVTSIVFPRQTTEISTGCFSGCSSLREITLHDGVTAIKEDAFENCSSLTQITIPKKVTVLNSNTFSGCSSLQSIVLPDRLTSIGSQAFKNCASLKSVAIPEGITEIAWQLFMGCSSLQSVKIPNSVLSIDEYAFAGCSSLKGIRLPENITKIPSYCFYGCTSLRGIRIPSQVVEIYFGAFENTGIRNFVIPKTVKIMYSDVNGRLENISVPLSVGNYHPGMKDAHIYYEGSFQQFLKFFGESAEWYFNIIMQNQNYCFHFNDYRTDFTDDYIYGEITWVDEGLANRPSITINLLRNGKVIQSQTIAPGQQTYVFADLDISEAYTYTVSAETIEGYTTTQNGYDFRNTLTRFCWTVENDQLVLYGNGTMPDYAEGESPWYDLRDQITGVIIGKKITSIGRYAFCGMEKLSSISIADTVTGIGDHAFDRCVELNEIVLPDHITAVGSDIVKNTGVYLICTRNSTTWNTLIAAGYHPIATDNRIVADMKLPANTRVIGERAFEGLAMTSVELPYTLTGIGSYAFLNCKQLETVIVRGCSFSVADNAFEGCDSLTSVMCSMNNLTMISFAQTHGLTIVPIN